MADETGLGKTHVAQEVIAQALKHLKGVEHVGRIDIVYVCSNADIAAQNIRKLDVTDSDSPSFATRLSLLITQPDVLQPTTGGKGSRPLLWRSRRRHRSSSDGNWGERMNARCSMRCFTITWTSVGRGTQRLSGYSKAACPAGTDSWAAMWPVRAQGSSSRTSS